MTMIDYPITSFAGMRTLYKVSDIFSPFLGSPLLSTKYKLNTHSSTIGKIEEKNLQVSTFGMYCSELRDESGSSFYIRTLCTRTTGDSDSSRVAISSIAIEWVVSYAWLVVICLETALFFKDWWHPRVVPIVTLWFPGSSSNNFHRWQCSVSICLAKYLVGPRPILPSPFLSHLSSC